MKNSLNTISLIASIITVINFALSIALSFEGLTFDLLPTIAASFETRPLFFRIIVFLLLEVFISYIFVKIYLFIVEKGQQGDPLSFILKVVLLMCSAWTTLFNVQWLILSYFTDRGAWIVFLILATVAANFIWTYWYKNETKEEEDKQLKPSKVFFLHALFIGIVFAIQVIDQSI